MTFTSVSESELHTAVLGCSFHGFNVSECPHKCNLHLERLKQIWSERILVLRATYFDTVSAVKASQQMLN